MPRTPGRGRKALVELSSVTVEASTAVSADLHPDRVATGGGTPPEDTDEGQLRPHRLTDYVGQAADVYKRQGWRHLIAACRGMRRDTSERRNRPDRGDE